MYRKLISSLLFIFAFLAIALSGYQCATQVTHDTPGGDTRGSIPINDTDFNDPNPDPVGPYYYDKDYDGLKIRDSEGGNPNLPQEPEDNCPKGKYRELAQKLGEMAILRLDSSSLEDYRLGKALNFGVNCARMYLNMNKLSSASRTYRGLLGIAYDSGRYLFYNRFHSGLSGEENKYNKWSGGSWTANRNGSVNKKFHAIFEDEFGAVILKIDDVRIRDIRDGKTAYFAAGEIYYKMFRILTEDLNDVCYSKGTYVSVAPQQPPRRARCWLLGRGAFSCLPAGIPPGDPRDRAPNIDITGNLRCYNRLGIFFNLNIEEAFHVGDVRELY